MPSSYRLPKCKASSVICCVVFKVQNLDGGISGVGKLGKARKRGSEKINRLGGPSFTKSYHWWIKQRRFTNSEVLYLAI